MVKLSSIQPQRLTKAEVKFGDEVLHVDIDANAFTIGWSKRFQEASTNGDIPAVAKEFFALVQGWDLTDDDDEVFPLDEETIHRLSLPTFFSISGAIIDQIDPNDFAPKKSRKR